MSAAEGFVALAVVGAVAAVWSTHTAPVCAVIRERAVRPPSPPHRGNAQHSSRLVTSRVGAQNDLPLSGLFC